MTNGVTFEDVARLVCSRVGWPYDSLTTAQWEQVRTEINAALKAAWESFWWESLMATERLTLRSDWAIGTAYTAGDEIYHADSDDYYTALQASTGQAPASLSGNDWVTNYAYWARLSEPESVDEGSWESGIAYSLGDRVDWHGSEYACTSAHTSSAVILPSNTSYWGEIPPFDYTVAYAQSGRAVIGQVRAAYEEDPRSWPETNTIEFQPAANGLRFINLSVTRPWVVYRVRCPDLRGDDYSSTTAYTAESDELAIWGL